MTKTIKTENQQCRTCSSFSKKWKPLSAKIRDFKKMLKSLGELLEELTEIKAKDIKYPDLPQFLCINCCRQLKAAHSFVEQAKAVNEKLYSELNDRKLHHIEENQNDLETSEEYKLKELKQHEVLDKSLEIKFENNEKHLMRDEELEDCLLETEIDIENDVRETKVEDRMMQQIEDKLDLKQDKGKTSKPTSSNNDSHNSESSNSSSNSDWEDNTNTIKQIKTKISPENTELNDIAVPCCKCNKIFKNSKLLAVHQRISHIPEEKKCTCHLCGNKFTRYCNMYKHMRVFHGPETVKLISKRPEEDYIYKCELCPKKYSRKKSLVYHTKLKHSPTTLNKEEIEENKKHIKKDKEKALDKGSLCPICGSSFTSKNQLTVHLRRHSGERPFKCDLCERAFLLVTQLNSHKRLHTGEKPYKCQQCAKAFRVSDDLRQHMRTHMNVRPHKCSQCERSFKHPQDLKIHLRSHTGERPYVCAVCGDSFQRYNTLRAHRIRMSHVEEIS